VFSTRESLRARKAALLAEGRELILSGGFGEMGEFCYFEIPEIASPVELMYLRFEMLPPPEKVIE